MAAELLPVFLFGNPSAPRRRPPSSAVSALVLSLPAPLLRLFLRVSAPPRQNYTLGFPSPFHHDPVRGMNSALPLRSLCRSEEHTSELQSLRHLVCRLLL